MPAQTLSLRPRSAPSGRQKQGPFPPLISHFAIRAQLRKRYGTVHTAWHAVSRKKPEVDRETLYVGLYRAGIIIPDPDQFEALWAYCDPEGVGALSYRTFCAAFANADASVSLHRRTPPPGSTSSQHGAVLRSGARLKMPADITKRSTGRPISPPRQSADGEYLGTSVEACVHDEADVNNGTHLSFEALGRALQRANLGLGEKALHNIWDKCLAMPDFHACPAPEPAPPSGVQEPYPFFMRCSGRPREPFPNTGRGTSDLSSSLPLGGGCGQHGGLPTRPGNRDLTPAMLAESCSGDASAVSCATAIRVLRDYTAKVLERQSWRAWRASCMTVPVDTQRPTQEYEVHDVVNSWKCRTGSVSLAVETAADTG